jgi:hypothetical protein
VTRRHSSDAAIQSITWYGLKSKVTAKKILPFTFAIAALLLASCRSYEISIQVVNGSIIELDSIDVQLNNHPTIARNLKDLRTNR